MKILTESKETRPKEKWDSLEEYILYLKQFAGYEFAKRFTINQKVLEVGYGAGYGAYYLSNFASEFIAIDISKINSSYCQARYPKDNLIFMMGDATKLPFKDNQFDVAMSFQVIEHIEPKFVLTYLTEIKRVLKVDGIFICSTPNKKLRLLPFQKPWNPEHKNEYNRKDFKNLLNKIYGGVKVYCLSASEEALSVERARVKQDPLKVYIISPIYRLMKTILPSAFFVRLKEVNKRFISSNRSQKPIQHEDFLTKFSIKDFQVDSSCSDNCLDILGICKKTKNPQDFTTCAGNKELAD